MSKINFAKLSEGRLHGAPKSHIPEDLRRCTHVWLRIDRVRRPLEAPYAGPHEVISRHENFFTIKTDAGVEQNVSMDRLKPVHNPNLFEGLKQRKREVPVTSPLPPSDKLEKETSKTGDLSVKPSDAASEPRKSRFNRIAKHRNKIDCHYY
jgi:hypothetical protein